LKTGSFCSFMGSKKKTAHRRVKNRAKLPAALSSHACERSKYCVCLDSRLFQGRERVHPRSLFIVCTLANHPRFLQRKKFTADGLKRVPGVGSTAPRAFVGVSATGPHDLAAGAGQLDASVRWSGAEIAEVGHLVSG